MTEERWDDDVDQEPVGELSGAQLGVCLLAGVQGAGWAEQAPVGLIVSHGTWLVRREFRQAVDLWVKPDGLKAYVDWTEVEDWPASDSEVNILPIARSLAGLPPEQALRDLLPGLDRANTERVLDAVAIACRGPSGLRARNDRRGGPS